MPIHYLKFFQSGAKRKKPISTNYYCFGCTSENKSRIESSLLNAAKNYLFFLCLIFLLFFFSLCLLIFEDFLFLPQGTLFTHHILVIRFLITPYFLSRALLCFLISRISFSISSILIAISAGCSLLIAFDSLFMISISLNNLSFCIS